MALRSFFRRAFKPLLGRAGAYWRWSYQPHLRYRLFHDPVDLLLYSLSASFSEVRFAQLGANDGSGLLEPFLMQPHWSGVLVEPVPYLFDALSARYGGVTRLRLERCAIDAQRGERRFHYFAKGTTDLAGADQLGTFSAERMATYCKEQPSLAHRVITEQVEARTLSDLLRQHALHELHLLQMDLEGSDLDILRSLDLSGEGPVLIIYEHALLNVADETTSETLLQGAGYDTLAVGQDTIALHANAPRRMRKAWTLVLGVGISRLVESVGPAGKTGT